MTPIDYPTDIEKADAADRLLDAEDRVRVALNEMRVILAERPYSTSGPTRSAGKLFSGIDGALVRKLIDSAGVIMWDIHKIVAVQGYDCRRGRRRR